MTIYVKPGLPTPFGATVVDGGTNFAIFSRNATQVWLLLFDTVNQAEPSHTFLLDPIINRTGDIWHIHVAGVGHEQLYLYRMDGPYKPEEGHRFNRHKPLLDPYAKAITNHAEWDFDVSLGYDVHDHREDLSFSTYTNYQQSPKCVVCGNDGFDWEGDRPLNRPLQETIIYETHVRSLTCHPSARVEHPGTFGGVVEMIPYFKKLGVTAIELLPIHAFNEFEFVRHNPHTGERLRNYWGYNTASFFAPHEAYSHYVKPADVVFAFKEMVRALHQAGLEVILDVVFNHTVEGNRKGPTFSFRGIDNRIYYMLEDNRRFYRNYSGTGNTFNANHPIVRDFILDCLRYWVSEMHVDGFRFDLATALCRNEIGLIPSEPPLPIHIAEDPLLRYTKIIAEPWDIGGYQVGHFPGKRWSEWNDKYRDQVRQYWHGAHGLNTALTTRLAGSSDLYGFTRTPSHSINFIAAHDGFTLNDVVSYNGKHNEANGEHNADGHNHNISYNYGHEGPTNDRHIEATRNRQVKNYLATLLLSQGTPMINGGDEFRRTQHGNNNAYCQHNEISWYNWDLLRKHADIFDFTKAVIALRQAYPVFRRTTFFTGVGDVRWLSPMGHAADWHSHPKELMCLISGKPEHTGYQQDSPDVLMLFNAHDGAVTFHLHPVPREALTWHVALDTSLAPPHDAYVPGQEPVIEEPSVYNVGPRSMVVLVAKLIDETTRWMIRLTPHKHVVQRV